MEAFRPTAGSVITFGYDNLGKVSFNISVEVREVRDGKGVGARGLRVQIAESQFRDEFSFVDVDEVPELIKGIDALLEVKDNPTPFKDFEVRYKTRGDLELTAFNTSKGPINYSVKVGRLVGARAFINASDMQQLRALVDSGEKKLASLPDK